ncbi:small secreted domain DUF320 [Stackebrandtia endophytica]|uniref:Small secreted domain DUF320 n=1 Tax=Stackebrandtia endophytica TaxID=1496996 RepID=A0A543AX88_9ACTN|nr:chaplin [Stackebrandtia endophytica]TQL77195.1 small secreted domain DUF320 [Stackebrandtia endophytica]
MTKTWARRTMQTGAIAAGLLLFAGGTATAGGLGDMVSAGNNGVLNGNQIQAPIQVPINVCGNAIAVAGVAGAGCHGGADANLESGGLGDMVTAGNQGIGNGNQVQAPIQIPINVCGNAIAVLGVAGAGCHGGADANIGSGYGHESAQVEELGNLPGTDTVTQLAGQLPGGDVVSGLTNALPTDGLATADLANQGGTTSTPADARAMGADQSGQSTESAGHPEDSGDMVSAGNNGILNGNQLKLPIQIPIDISGNAIGILGVAGAGSHGGADANMG